jgi:hypothetical protein
MHGVACRWNALMTVRRPPLSPPAAPRLLLTAVTGGASCSSDPVITCLSDFVLKIKDATCA